MAPKRKTPGAQLPELDKPAPVVPKLKDVIEVHGPITSPGRPSEYNGEETCKLAKNMAKAGLSHSMIARIFGIAPSTLSLWKAQHPAFLKALEQGTEQVDKALEATAMQRALGYSYETEKAFQTGVKITVTEHVPPDANLLKFMLERRQPEKYKEVKEVQHTHNAGKLFQEFLTRMDEVAKLKLKPMLLEAETIEEDVTSVLPKDDVAQENNEQDQDISDYEPVTG
jgi:transposase-like protein